MRVRTDHIPSVNDYTSAKRAWEKSKPWRGDTGEHAPRDLGDRRKKHMSVRLGNNGQYIFRLYDTDVVTYFADGTIKLQGYVSASTNAFANQLTPRGVSCSFPYVGLLDRNEERQAYQCLNGEMLLREVDGLFEPVGETKPFVMASLNRRRANEAKLRLRYDEFATWLKASIAMGRKFEGGTPHWSDVPPLLRNGPDSWPVVVNGWSTVNQNLERVRLALYRSEDCVDVEHVPSVRWFSVNDVIRQAAKYGVAA